jgi:hypothetical protein
MLNVLDQVAQGRKPALRTAASFAVASARSPLMWSAAFTPEPRSAAADPQAPFGKFHKGFWPRFAR